MRKVRGERVEVMSNTCKSAASTVELRQLRRCFVFTRENVKASTVESRQADVVLRAWRSDVEFMQKRVRRMRKTYVFCGDGKTM